MLTHLTELARRLADALHPLARRVVQRYGLVASDVVPLALMALCCLVIVAGLASGAEIYESVRDNTSMASLDRPVLDWAISQRSPGRDSAVTGFTHLGGPVWFPVILVVLLAAFTWQRRTASPAIVLLGGIAGALAFTMAGKDLTGRARPPHALAVPPYENSPSFPSGHTVTATVAAALVAYLVVKTVGSPRVRAFALGLAAAWAVLMGLSRVFLGHHWLTDVLSGWVLGLAWSALVIVLNEARLFLREKHRTAAADTSDANATSTTQA